MKKIFFPNLDGLRFVAFFMVYLWHAFELAFSKLNIQNKFLSNFFYAFANGKTGVSIFFVLSGFLITYLILKEIEFKGKLNVRKFYIRRFLRIWPLYYLILLVIFIGIPVIIKLSGLDWSKYDMHPVWYFIYLSNFDVLRIYHAGTLDFLPSTVTWSVAIEEQFYLLWPLFFYFIRPALYKFIFPLIIIACYAFRVYHHDDPDLLYFHTLSVCGDLALGGYAAWLSINNDRFKNYFVNQKAGTRMIFYFAGLVVIYFVQLLNDYGQQSWSRIFQTLFFTYVILDQNFAASTNLKFSNNRIMSRLGKYTYGLYLYHPLVLVLLTTLISKFFHLDVSSPANLAFIGLVAFPLCIAVSYLSYRYFESLFLKIKLRFSYITKEQDQKEETMQAATP